MASPNAGYPHPRLGKTYPRITCSNCGKTKLATRFPKRGGPTYEKYKATDIRRYDTQCKLCKKPVPANAGAGYKHEEPITKNKGRPKNKKRYTRSKKTAREAKQITRIETRIRSMSYLAKKGCEECDERDPRKLEYDHKDPANKHRGISRLITDGYSWSSPILRAEIRKCRILCANCHRVHTIKQQGYYASDAVQRHLSKLAKEHGFKS